MSVSSSSSAGGPSLGQMLIDRAFSTPPRHMIDGELIHALEGAHASDAEKVVPPTGDQAGATTGDQPGGTTADQPAPKAVDVRA